MPEIMKKTAVLKRSEFGYTSYANFIPFEYADTGTGLISRTVVLARKDVDELGWPEEITVTIEAGNSLPSGAVKQETVAAAPPRLESV